MVAGVRKIVVISQLVSDFLEYEADIHGRSEIDLIRQYITERSEYNAYIKSMRNSAASADKARIAASTAAERFVSADELAMLDRHKARLSLVDASRRRSPSPTDEADYVATFTAFNMDRALPMTKAMKFVKEYDTTYTGDNWRARTLQLFEAYENWLTTDRSIIKMPDEDRSFVKFLMARV